MLQLVHIPISLSSWIPVMGGGHRKGNVCEVNSKGEGFGQIRLGTVVYYHDSNL